MIASSHKPLLGSVLVDLGLVDADQLSTALLEQRRRRERIGETLVGLGFIERRQLKAALAEQRRRWLAGAFGAVMMALQPLPALARSASAQLSVSLQVVDAPKTAAQAASKLTESIGPNAASVSLACNEPSLVHVSLAAGQTAAAARPPKMQTAVCTQTGQPVALSIPLAGGDTPVRVEIAY